MDNYWILMDFFLNYISKCTYLMNKRTPVSAYKMLSSPSIKRKRYVNSHRSPCMKFETKLFRGILWSKNKISKTPSIFEIFQMCDQHLILYNVQHLWEGPQKPQNRFGSCRCPPPPWVTSRILNPGSERANDLFCMILSPAQKWSENRPMGWLAITEKLEEENGRPSLVGFSY